MNDGFDLTVWQGNGFVGFAIETDDSVCEVELSPELARGLADMLTRASFGAAQIPSAPIAQCERHLRPVESS